MFRILILHVIRRWAAASRDTVDNYDYFSIETWCGDQSIAYNKPCYCGEEQERLLIYNGPKYCCVDPSPDNITHCSVDEHGHGICPQGRVLDKTKPCDGHCFNDYYTSELIGHDSQYHCGDKCVPVWQMCRGYSGCQDSSDVAVCNENLTCVADRGDTEVRQLESDLSDEHFYCSYGDNQNDGQYDTITRQDEDDLDIRRQKVKIDYSSLTECHSGVTPGLKCSGGLGGCWANFNWCRRDISISCDGSEGTFATNNQGLCSNTIFWQNKTCEVFYDYGDKAALGERCSGGAQHCIYPWYLSSNYYYEVALI